MVEAIADESTDAPGARCWSTSEPIFAADRPPTPFARPPSDTSIQVHACHGTIRQLEVIRDALGHLFAGDPTLRPDDVVVICPDLPRFEPFAAAVFARGTLPIPVAVSDLSLGTENPVAAALAAILHTVAGRCTASDRARRRRPRTGAPPPGDHRRRPRPVRWLDAAARHEVGPRRRSPWRVARRRHRPRHVGAVTALVAPRGRRCRPPRRGSPSTASCRSTTSAATTSPASVASPSWSPASAGSAGCPPGAARSGSGATSSSTPSTELCAAPPAEAWQTAAVLEAIDDVRRAAAVGESASSVPLAFDDLLAVVDGVVAHRRGPRATAHRAG